ncbi:WYL domain-containing protein [Marinobacter sp.]|uniref:helix-turn-helix transcriptional regulator n=1 Tax=Marinobacter sp. TaxID=50741 RepID=UPI00263955C6|nr:WYL domain-containing protein [Marinobacter sp.]
MKTIGNSEANNMSLHERDKLILELLREEPRSYSELELLLKERGFNYSKRSIERRLPKLKLQGHPIVKLTKGTGHKRHVWKWQKRPTNEASGNEEQQITEDYQALAIALAERYWSIAALPEREKSLSKLFEEAHEQLTHSESREARWYKKARAVEPSHWLKEPQLKKHVFDTIRCALLREEPIRISYKSHNRDTPYKVTVTPLGIFFRGRVAYLISHDHDSRVTRNRPISRIVEAQELLTEPEIIPNDFDIDAYIKSNAESITYGEPIRLKAVIFDSVEREIAEAHLGGNQAIKPYGTDKRFKLLEVDVPYTLDVIQWLLARAAYLKVLEPIAFKEKFEEEIRRMYINATSEAPDVPRKRNYGA